LSIRTWSKDFVSGFHEVDEQHQHLFRTLNAFAEECNENTPNHILISFLDDLAQYCEFHFTVEEDMMQQYGYPLQNYHSDVHKNLKRSVKLMRRQLEKNEVKNPFQSILAFSRDWLNHHIAREDLAFFSYCRNIGYSLSRHFSGRMCEIHTMSNRLAGTGRINRVTGNTINIINMTKAKMPFNLNDIVKVTSLSANHKKQTFIARVYFSTRENLRLLDATVIQTVNNREHFRVPTNLKAKLRIFDSTYTVDILDISVGGLMINCPEFLETGSIVTVEFVVQNKPIKTDCKVVRTITQMGKSNTYGLMFDNISAYGSDEVSSYVFNRQTLLRAQLSDNDA
jgi:hemerythrin